MIILIILFSPIKYFLEVQTKNKHACLTLNIFFIKLKFDNLNHKNKKTKNKSKKAKKNTLEEKIINKINEMYDEKEKTHDNLNLDKLCDKIFIIKTVLYLLCDIFKKIKPKKICVNGELGFDDPYQTGCFCAFECVALNNSKLKSNIKYNFNNKIFDLNFVLCGNIFLFCVAGILIKYIFSCEVISFIKKMFANKNKEVD
jgi:hypothetical protein